MPKLFNFLLFTDVLLYKFAFIAEEFYANFLNLYLNFFMLLLLNDSDSCQAIVAQMLELLKWQNLPKPEVDSGTSGVCQ
jgi:hypothetical protein